MIRNYFIIALRNIWRNKTFSAINIIGLAVSMSLGLLIILIIRGQYQFDNFHSDAERIYRVNTTAQRVSGETENYASVPLALATLLKGNYSFSEEVVRLNRWLNCDAKANNTVLPVHGFFADASFLKVFNFKLEKGNPSTALSSPDGIILTHDAAKKIFGNDNPIGKTVTLNGYGNYIVSGVFENFPGKTHFDFEVLASINALPALEKQNIVSPSLQDWTNYYAGHIYLKLKEGRTQKEVEAALSSISKKQYAGLKLETRDKGYEFHLQPLNKISPGPILSNSMGRAVPELVLIFLGTLAAIIMIMAGLNYTNLMIAKSLKRAREIGVRKVMGANRMQVFFQFIGESVVFALFALIFSWLLLQLIKSSFLRLQLTQSFSFDLREDGWIYLSFVSFALLVGIIAGLLPALYLSGFKPVIVLKNVVDTAVKTKLSFRKVLMVVQFSLSLIFVVCVLFIYHQVQFMLSANYGINEKNLLNLHLQGQGYETYANEIRNVSGVQRVGAVSHSLGTSQDRASDYRRNKTADAFVMRDFRADADYLKNLQVQFVAGRNFKNNLSKEKESEVILNETALTSFGFPNAHAVLGQTIYADDSLPLQVVGVVRDFHFRTFESAIGPLAFRYRPADFNLLSIAFNPAAKNSVIAATQSIWKKYDPVHTIQCSTMEDEIDQAYIESGYNDIVKILAYISFLAITIACLGMLGMVMYSTQLKVKEIGVRKVLGASVKDVTVLLSKSFIKLIAISTLIGIPSGYFLGNLFLQNFPYRISDAPLLVLFAILITGSAGIITICSQTIKAAIVNPVNSLRTE